MRNLSERALLFVFSITLLIASFLLFWVQPLLAKMLLPFLGGSPSVWNTCMMFFQGVLLAGYLYAHLSARFLPKKAQIIVHIGLLSAGVLFLPFVVDSHWVPQGTTPALSLVIALFGMAALPLFALSASAPLIQRWFTHTNHRHSSDPYFLYVASNIGSFCALLAFPLLLEPWLTLRAQNWAWSVGFILLLVLTLLSSVSALGTSNPASHVSGDSQLEAKPSFTRKAYWVLLAFAPSSLLLGVTTYITTDIASAPLFWVVPFILYLLSFIIVFSRRPVISQNFSGMVQLILMAPFLYVLSRPLGFFGFPIVLSIHLAFFFFTAMVCHSELVAKRPHHQYLTEFYLLMAFGGFLGGVFNALIAPIVFSGVYEYHIVYMFAIILCPPALLSRRYALALVCCVAIIFVLSTQGKHDHSIYAERNFFGTTRVKQMVFQGKDTHVLVHGTTIHGAQFIKEKGRPKVLSYYYPLESLMQLLRNRTQSLKIAVAGLGAGVSACTAGLNDELTFYEIDPSMVLIAQDPQYFTYLERCPPKGGIILGDARIQLAQVKPSTYDVIVLDVFSSDSIPVHLMTQQAIEIYLNKLRDDGVLLIHISNRYMRLERVLAAISEKLGVYGWLGLYQGDRKANKLRARWVALSKNPDPFGPLWNRKIWQPLPKNMGSHLWTDDYSNIVREFRWD